MTATATHVPASSTPTTADYAATLLRLTAGAIFLTHGLIKIFVFTVPGTVGFFESLGFPGFFAYLAILAEVGGGIALLLGVVTRLAAIGTLFPLLGAFTVHVHNGFTFSNNGGGWEYVGMWIMVNVAILLLGRGVFAVKIPALQKVLGPFA